MKWEVGKVYLFTPSGDATDLKLIVLAKVPFSEAAEWYRETYDREPEDQTPPLSGPHAFKAKLLRGGEDADITHRRGDIYYVFLQEEPDEIVKR